MNKKILYLSQITSVKNRWRIFVAFVDEGMEHPLLSHGKLSNLVLSAEHQIG